MSLSNYIAYEINSDRGFQVESDCTNSDQLPFSVKTKVLKILQLDYKIITFNANHLTH